MDQCNKTYPVPEIFGPTIQGEGALCGVQTHFVRFGGCDFRCSWCDSMHAVDPQEVRKAPRLKTVEIFSRVLELGSSAQCPWVTFSGGNPAIHNLLNLVVALKGAGYYIAVETQGTILPQWLLKCNQLTFSPKPPSSGMDHKNKVDYLRTFLCSHVQCVGTLPIHRRPYDVGVCVKIVVDPSCDHDMSWAMGMYEYFNFWPFYIQPVTPANCSSGQLCSILATLAEKVMGMDMPKAIILPQMHVLMWGHKLGV